MGLVMLSSVAPPFVSTLYLLRRYYHRLRRPRCHCHQNCYHIFSLITFTLVLSIYISNLLYILSYVCPKYLAPAVEL